ncbi:MAG: hypothetical protein AB7G23_02915 [Vicinamibacterales bacterium]
MGRQVTITTPGGTVLEVHFIGGMVCRWYVELPQHVADDLVLSPCDIQRRVRDGREHVTVLTADTLSAVMGAIGRFITETEP